jgi:hypothetical protein
MALYGLGAVAGALVFGAALFLPSRALLRVLELLSGLLSGLLLFGGWARLLLFGGAYGRCLDQRPISLQSGSSSRCWPYSLQRPYAPCSALTGTP